MIERGDRDPRQERRRAGARIAKESFLSLDTLELICRMWLDSEDAGAAVPTRVRAAMMKLPLKERDRVPELVAALRSLADAFEQTQAELAAG